MACSVDIETLLYTELYKLILLLQSVETTAQCLSVSICMTWTTLFQLESAE